MAALEPGRVSKGRILAVDDEDPLRELYETVLTEAGYEVATAADGASAIRLLDSGPFDAVLTDIYLPDSTGVELLREVRRRDLDLPVILATGNPSVDTAVQAIELGALRYLVKPVDERTLLRSVDQAVQLHRLARLKREALVHLGAEGGLVGDRAGLEATYQDAVAHLWIAYQALVRAADGSTFGHEALLRTDNPAVPGPGAFLEIAERLGRAPILSRLIRERVAAGPRLEGDLFVNLLPTDLADDSLYRADAPLARRASQVVVEITERSSLEAIPDLRDRVARLREMGFRIAVDDLGAGYAGLNSFAALEPDIVKLDMSLIRDVDHEPLKRRLVGSMARLCRDLGILVVAEGIETVAERDTVVELGCDLLQGYLIARPTRAPS